MSKTGIAVFASGRGTNFEALARAQQNNGFAGEIRLLVVNVPDAPVLHRAEALKIPAVVVSHRDFRKRAEFEQAVVKELAARDIGLVCLAGFNRILSPFFIKQYPHKVINIHPSLLPAFAGLQGMQVHEAVIAAGVKVSGCTVHFVTDDVDAGPIIVQRAIPVREDDTPESLAIRVLVEEHQAYPEAVRLFCAGKLEVRGRVVRVLA
ncbi:MAG: phosphoribosylglycinamide formyltransferase [candidate division WOR-3 bacterium]